MSIVVEALGKAFGSNRVLDAVTETFEAGKISVLLGPSGCGKTTTLRCIAGLERPAEGRIVVAGTTVFQRSPPIWVPPERRRLSMVFQSYAIWPHMSVFENVGLPLRAAGSSPSQIVASVEQTLRMVGLAEFAGRSATELSGGQQQRVALARCIVSDAPVILMDEPLSNLDARLRVSMRGEIRALQRRLGRTVLFVTHDQEEALSIADTVYLFREGRVVQRGVPKDLYQNPATRYAAEFLGRANIIEHFGWERTVDGARFTAGEGVALPSAGGAPPAPGAMLCIRPEKWRLTAPEEPGALAGVLVDASFVGDRTEYRVDTPLGRLLVTELDAIDRQPGDRVGLIVRAPDIKVVAA
jgi:iron(III) transport system ATP-binding protein